MRVVLQRVSEARVRVDDRITGEIGPGLLLLCAFRENDTDKEMQWMADKLCDLRIFRDDEDKMNRSVRDLGFRSRYDAAVVAVHRNAEHVPGKIGEIVMRPGDVLLMQAAPDFARTVDIHRNSSVVDRPLTERQALARQTTRNNLARTLRWKAMQAESLRTA